jgi:hypothetical protein
MQIARSNSDRSLEVDRQNFQRIREQNMHGNQQNNINHTSTKLSLTNSVQNKE